MEHVEFEINFNGEGYLQILLYSEEENNRIWAIGSLSLKPGILCLHEWSSHFNPEIQKMTKLGSSFT